MKINKTITISCIILAFITFIASFCCTFKITLRDCNQILDFINSILISLFTGAMVGIIAPLACYFSSRRQAQRKFYYQCRKRLNKLIDIKNFYNENYNKLLTTQCPNIPQNEIEELTYNTFYNNVKKGVSIIKDYSDMDTEIFYELIDDYSGLFKEIDTTKNIMYSIRDKFNEFDYNLCQDDLDFRYKIQQVDSCKFEPAIWLRDVLTKYNTKTKILEDNLDEINNLIKQFVSHTKLDKYTQKAQGNKKKK